MSQLGTLRFPPLPAPRMATLAEPDASDQALLTLLLTEPGERVGRPRYGVDLRRFLHQPDTVALRTAVRQAVASAIHEHLPRVRLAEVLVSSAPDQPGLLVLDVRWFTPGAALPRSLRLPLSLNAEVP